MSQPTFDVELIRTQWLTDSTLELTFQTDGLSAFEAGQFVSFFLPLEKENGDNTKGKTIRRSYSVASSPEELKAKGVFQIAVALVPNGQASACFSAAQPGSVFPVTGPFGQLTLPVPEQLQLVAPDRLVLVGTGTGMAPYRSMLPQLQQLRQQGQKIHLLMGVRQRCDLFYVDDFHSLTNEEQPVPLDCCLSREEITDPAAGEHSGYVQDRLAELSLLPG
ncbi:MAG: FAD-dependent oxidoreductase, partial [Kistimonas sp.]|nr:FAD-dependent oxidoreductase [Kistimonas sp.]